MVQSDHKALSLNQGLWQNKAVCDTAATAPAWQPPHFPSSPCLGSWPTFPCRPAKRIKTEEGEEGERRGEAKGKKRALLFFSCLLTSPPVTSPPLLFQMRFVQKCFSPGLFDLAVHFINVVSGAVSQTTIVWGVGAPKMAPPAVCSIHKDIHNNQAISAFLEMHKPDTVCRYCDV